MTTLKDVALLSGVSTWTASKVLSGSAKAEKISAVAARRVSAAARKLKYSPNHQAKMLRKGRSMVIGILLGSPNQQDEYWKSFSGIMISGMDQEIRARGFDTLMIGTRDGNNIPDTIRQYFNEKRIDGLLIPDWFCPDPIPASLLKTPGPVVLAGCHDTDRFPRVHLDDGAGIQAAVRHLAGLGHRRILWLSFRYSKNSHSSLARRRNAFWKEIESANLSGDELFFEPPGVVCSHLSTEAIRQTRAFCLANWKQITSGTAVVCYNERIALGLYAAARDSGVEIPRRLSVVGFDDLIADVAWPPLTTVSHRLDEIGRRSAALVTELSSQSAPGPRRPAACIRVDASLVIRESTAPPAGKRASCGGV